MDSSKIASLWNRYQDAEVDMTIDPGDHMLEHLRLLKNEDDAMRGYRFCGDSGIRAIMSAITMSLHTVRIEKILDYGCGSGRVGRNIRAMFPDASLYFSDTASDRADFCAKQFNGSALPASSDFDVSWAESFDLIWVGSLFTHIDLPKMQKLFDMLWSVTNKNGLLIGTFHGPSVLDLPHLKLQTADKWNSIVEQFNKVGWGYESYEKFPEIGVSLTSPSIVRDLGTQHNDARMVLYSDVGWAGLQDVAAWTKI